MPQITPTFFYLAYLFQRKITKSGCFLILSFLIPTFGINAQEYQGYDEFPVVLNVPKLGTIEFPVAIKGQEAYLSVSDLFDFLKIKTETDNTSGIISGFYVNPENTYQIDPTAGKIIYRGETYPLPKEDFIKTPTSFYLKSDYFGRIFGLNTDFNFRNLSVTVETEEELPVIKQQRLDRMRKNLDQVKGVVKPDTIIERKYPFLKGGMLDWGVITTQQTNGPEDNRLSLGLGTMIAGGEANALLNYSTRVPFTSRNQFYQWKYVNNDSKVFKQVTAGKIFTNATSSLFAPVVGVQLSNTPVRNRRSFGTYTLTDFTEPRWTVELYVNNVLIDFTQADASGFYSFEVPLMYGNTSVNLKFYGPWGEERTEDRMINIPYNFVPKTELEYTLSAGMVENEENDRFSRFNLNYGLTNGLTIGGGVEYLSETESGEFMPFINSSLRLASSLLFSGEYMYNVKAEALLSYRSPSNLQLDLNYIKYDEDQTAINYNYLEERKISLSAPIRSKHFNAFSRFSVNQIILPTTEFTTAQLLLSGVVLGVSTNLTTYALYNDRVAKPTVYTSLSQTYRLPKQFLFSPQIQYDFRTNNFTNLVLEVERPIFENGFVNIGYENNFIRNAHIFEFGLRYNVNFAQTSMTSRLGNRNSSFVQSARGSFLFDDNTGYITATNRTSVGKGGITIIPFLDLNINGKMDPMEKGVPGMELKNTLGRLTYNEDETVIRITDIQPYIETVLEIDPVSLDNIAWKVRNPKIAVETVPNQFKAIYVPIEAMGEVSGMIFFKEDGTTKGLGRVILNIFDENGNEVASILSESDGYFNYLGLPPGNYTAQIDSGQLENLGYEASPSELEFKIEIDEYGDIVDTLEFVLEEKKH
ncbi:hypothetical protein [Salegentibacter chungangensis]|uniref:Carboxypeptidase regulatory-like domain-containing protein n=1 Tax=Salegentibacter chungangensis TaxID=1335724 RepID=A0ABW3NTQ0_9FLAO